VRSAPARSPVGFTSVGDLLVIAIAVEPGRALPEREPEPAEETEPPPQHAALRPDPLPG
jgi:hypothetical protein